jgi:hypothetical protein
MSKFNLPTEFIEDLSIYIGLSDKDKTKLEELISVAPIGLMPSDLSDYLSDKINIEKDNLDSITNVLYVLSKVKEESDLDLDEFIDGICSSYAAKKSKVNNSVKTRLKAILSEKGAFNLTRKINDLIVDRENVLTSSRIITDIRPVFGIEKTYDLINSLVIHNLKIEYDNDEGNTKSIYLALDKEDLKKLKEDILRAEKKETVIRSKFERATTFIDY